MSFIARLDKYIAKALMGVAMFCAAALFFVLLGNVLIRFMGIPDAMNWYTEIVEILFGWMVMCTASVLGYNKAHLVVDLIGMKYRDRYWYYLLKLLTNLIALSFFLCLFYYGIILCQGAVQTMPVLHIPRRWAYLCIPFNAFFLCAYVIRDVISNLSILFRKKVVPVS
jgi:TRAP-type C4-dicarboxylate transport system permease small subunit